MYKNSLKNSWYEWHWFQDLNVDLGYWKVFQFYLIGSTSSDCPMQVEDNRNMPLGLGEGWTQRLNRDDFVIVVKITVFWGK